MYTICLVETGWQVRLALQLRLKPFLPCVFSFTPTTAEPVQTLWRTQEDYVEGNTNKLQTFGFIGFPEKLVWSVCSIIFFTGQLVCDGIVTYLRNFGWCFHVPKIQGLLGPHFSLALGAGWSCVLEQSHKLTWLQMWFSEEKPSKHELVFLFKADIF